MSTLEFLKAMVGFKQKITKIQQDTDAELAQMKAELEPIFEKYGFKTFLAVGAKDGPALALPELLRRAPEDTEILVPIEFGWLNGDHEKLVELVIKSATRLIAPDAEGAHVVVMHRKPDDQSEDDPFAGFLSSTIN